MLASTALIVIFSAILYNYIKISIYEDLTSEVTKDVKQLVSQYFAGVKTLPELEKSTNYLNIHIKQEENRKKVIYFEQRKNENESILTINLPISKKNADFLSFSLDISNTDTLLQKIFQSIIIIDLSAMALILFYALLVARMLVIPINSLTKKLATMDENFFQSINTKNIPQEFEPLAKSINKLVDRIHTFVLYQKELFIGITHELKTPLAVMKTKNEVTLLRPRESEKYIETILQNITTINEMNKMIANILEIGRQEGAQFEKPEQIDIIAFLKERSTNFQILARQEEKNIVTNLSPNTLKILIQPTLLVHILQNFVQNAIKFSPKGGQIQIICFQDGQGFTIQVIDCGEGIDESKDLFAPFKRYGNKSGVGLGLFLAKGAADAIGGVINLKNRTDTQGTIATLNIPNSKINL